MTVMNNVMFVEDTYLKTLQQPAQEYLRRHLGQEANQTNTKTELEQILRKVSLKDATELINIEFSAETLVIKEYPEMRAHGIYMKDRGFYDNDMTEASIMIAINKAYCNLRRAEKMAKYLRVLGYGLHREIDDED